jgi:diguanylate cyclase (GGDEF)-like protein
MAIGRPPGRRVDVMPAVEPSSSGVGTVALDATLAALLPAALAWQGALLTVKDAGSGRYVHVDAAMATFLGRPVEAVVGTTDADLFEAAVATTLRSADQTALSQGDALVSDHKFEHAGERYEWSVLRTSVEAGGRRLLCSVWVDQRPRRAREAQLRTALDQLEAQQRANEALRRELKDQGLRDAASGLYTRSHFEDQLRREVDLSTREHREFALVLIEIDPLADEVRALGPAAEHRIFEAMGRLLRNNTRAMDASCRMDGSCFAVLLSGVGLATAHSRMEGFRRQCATQIVAHEGRELRFTVSMGVASFPHTAHSQDELISASQTALQEARRRGGNHVTLASIRFEGR